jgi:hypothetical protein
MVLAKSSKYVSNQFGKMTAKMLPRKPADYLLVDGERFSERLVHETEFEDDGRTVFVLGDEAVGTMWEPRHQPHEILTEKDLAEKMEHYSALFRMITDRRITFQVICDQKISDEFPLPKWDGRNTFARKALKKRIAKIKRLAVDPGDRPPLLQRRFYLTLRVERLPIKLQSEATLIEQLESRADNLKEAVQMLRDFSRSFEAMYFGRFGEPLKKSHGKTLAAILRDTLHGEDDKHGPFFSSQPDLVKDEPIRKQVLNGSVSWGRDFVGVGNDTWEMLSWSSQPTSIYAGLMTSLLQIKGPVRCVVNIRPANYVDDLETLSNQVKGGDPYQERQKRHVHATEDRVVGGETLLHCSLHILVRNVGVPALGPKDLRRGRSIAREFSINTFPCFVEDYAAMPVFMVALPFMASAKTDPFIARDKRVLSADIGSILPIFGGTLGSNRPCQLMQARSGEAIWLNQRAGLQNPHLAIFGGSQSGKSFNTANLIMSEFAADPDLMVFLIDSLCSYTYGARAIGEDHGLKFSAPPQSYPNLFRGEINKERLDRITEIINVAVHKLCDSKLDSAEITILGDAILATYKDNLEASQTAYVPASDPTQVGSYAGGTGQMKVPRMGTIVNKLTIVAERKDQEAVVKRLREKLLPFHGSGPYASIFDQDAVEIPDGRAPGFSIYELANLSKDVRTLGALITIDEIERLINHPANEGRRALLIVEEAGVNLGGNNPALEEWVTNAWLRFAKKNISCVMITNNTAHYLKLSACKAAWDTSASRQIFPVSSRTEAEGLAELLKPEDHYAYLATTLMKVPGAFSESLFLGDSVKGTVCFVPTGYDYWGAANHHGDKVAIEYAYEVHGSWQMAIHCLAEIAPMGFRDETSQLRAMTEQEKRKIKEYKYEDEDAA